jgi:hypothetical protein
MRFGIITPVFDGCLGSLELLFREIHHQTHKNWIWMLCSNGYSRKISQFIDKKNYILNKSRKNAIIESPSLVYLNMDYEETPDRWCLMADISKRRDYCIRTIDSDYILFIDADAKLLDSKMFEIISAEVEATSKAIYIYKIKLSKKRELPIFPISYGTIDTLNYCISTILAKQVGYPTTVNTEQYGNDFWFIDRCLKSTNGDYIFIDRFFGKYNGNNTYLNIQTLLGVHLENEMPAKLLRSLKALIYKRLLGPFRL